MKKTDGQRWYTMKTGRDRMALHKFESDKGAKLTKKKEI